MKTFILCMSGNFNSSSNVQVYLKVLQPNTLEKAKITVFNYFIIKLLANY